MAWATLPSARTSSTCLPSIRRIGRLSAHGRLCARAWSNPHRYALPQPAEWVKATAVVGGVVLASALSDKPVDRFVKKHEDSKVYRNWDKLGKAMPYAAVGAAAAAFALGR